MLLLILVSLLWAFSFGLIKQLGGVDSAFISAARLGIAFLVFLPFLRWRGLSGRTVGALFGIGAVQFGLMYLAYNESFRYLHAYEVALFTITTPIFVTLLADAFERRFHARAFYAALLAVVGTGLVVIRAQDVQLTLRGLALVQLSNVAFALGQVQYKRWRAANGTLHDRQVFALPYFGAFIVAVIALLARAPDVTLTAAQVWTLVYLGAIASGLGFFLWNLGATRASTGTLAVMNNAKIPLAVTVSLVFFGERGNPVTLLASLAIMAIAVWIAERK